MFLVESFNKMVEKREGNGDYPLATTHIIVVKINMNNIKKLEHNQNLYLIGRQKYNQNLGLGNIITPADGIPKRGNTADILARQGIRPNIFMVANQQFCTALLNSNQAARSVNREKCQEAGSTSSRIIRIFETNDI
jgi:hypothetical protein